MLEFIFMVCFFFWLLRGRPLGCLWRMVYDIGTAIVSILAVYLLVRALIT